MKNKLAYIIEDDKDLSIIFSSALKAGGFEVKAFLSGEDALEKLQEVVPRVITLDLNLPGIPGKEVLAKIKADPKFAHIFLIIVTANPIMASELEDEVDLVLIKPISFTQMRDLIPRLVL